ncbi:MAG: hypothetical protein ACYC27_06155 [Armatimonadota bacterium]
MRESAIQYFQYLKSGMFLSAFTRMMLTICLTILVFMPAYGEVLITESDGSGSYDLIWNNCSFADIQRDIHTRLDQHSFAQVLNQESSIQSGNMKNQPPNLFSLTAGIHYGRDHMYIGDTPVFYPFALPSLSEAAVATAGKLINSLTPAQRSMHKSRGYLPFEELSGGQQQYVYFLAITFKKNVQYPEPELSKKLSESMIVLALDPSIHYEYDYIDENGKSVNTSSGFYCDREVSNNFWRTRLKGQMDASRSNAEATTKPGVDAPGGSTVFSLDGIYTLADLLKKVDDGSGTVKIQSDAAKVMIEAHCDMTGASIARACAVATGMDWQYLDDCWHLAAVSVFDSIRMYGKNVDINTYTREYERQIPAIQKMAYKREMVLLTDPAWKTDFNLGNVLDGKSIDWNTLSADQQDYLREGAMMSDFVSSPKRNLTEKLPQLKLSWHPNIRMFIITEDGILYHDWLRFKPLFPPEGEKEYLSQDTDTKKPK